MKLQTVVSKAMRAKVSNPFGAARALEFIGIAALRGALPKVKDEDKNRERLALIEKVYTIAQAIREGSKEQRTKSASGLYRFVDAAQFEREKMNLSQWVRVLESFAMGQSPEQFGNIVSAERAKSEAKREERNKLAAIEARRVETLEREVVELRAKSQRSAARKGSRVPLSA